MSLITPGTARVIWGYHGLRGFRVISIVWSISNLRPNQWPAQKGKSRRLGSHKIRTKLFFTFTIASF